MNNDRQATKDTDHKTPFWVTRGGARVALIAAHVAAAIAVAVELLLPTTLSDGHAAERVHALEFPASYALYGFIACVILVLLGIVLRKLVMRPETYYEGDPP